MGLVGVMMGWLTGASKSRWFVRRPGLRAEISVNSNELEATTHTPQSPAVSRQPNPPLVPIAVFPYPVR